MGGVFNTVNANLYHYAGNNPVRYTDPDGNDIEEVPIFSATVGICGAVRVTGGIAVDSKGNVAVFGKAEVGIGGRGRYRT